jgi:hypothetical protein
VHFDVSFASDQVGTSLKQGYLHGQIDSDHSPSMANFAVLDFWGMYSPMGTNFLLNLTQSTMVFHNDSN